MRTLRSRLILSHILPLLVIVPVIGLGLTYLLETQVVLTGLSNELEEQAAIIGELANSQSSIWSEADEAQVFVLRLDERISARITLLNRQGRILASSNGNDIGNQMDYPALATVLAGQPSARMNYSQLLRVEIVEVMVPVMGPDEQVIGIVRLTHELAGVYERFLNLRFWIGGVVVIELVVGVILGFILALNLERYLHRVTDSLYNIATGQPIPPLPQQGPEEVRSLFQAVNTLANRLQTLEEARRRLLANLVHELGRPLGALRSAVHALLHGAERDQKLRQELLKGMEAEILRLQPLLDNLAQLHGQILGTLELDRQLVVTSRWLSLVASPWQAAAEQKGLRWQMDIPLGLPPVSIDANQMAQVVGNLLSNAVKYTLVGGTVHITASAKNGALQIEVTDTGSGIVPEELERIFEPFHRSQTGRRFPQGMGLGLTIAQDIIIAHGGRLNVESTPGEGSRFTVTLPLVEAESSLSPP